MSRSRDETQKSLLPLVKKCGALRLGTVAAVILCLVSCYVHRIRSRFRWEPQTSLKVFSAHPDRRPRLDQDVDGRARQRRRSHQSSRRPTSSYSSSLQHLFTATTDGSPRVPSYGAASPTAAANHVWLPRHPR